MSATALGYARTNPARLRLTRVLGVAGSCAAALAVWTVAVPALGVPLQVRFGGGAPQTVGIGFVVGASLFASVLGWAVLAMLERRTPRARPIWTVIAIVVLVASLSLPLSAGTTMSTRITLALMHLSAAAVLIPMLRLA
jgi:hypothetical protein